MKLIHADCLDAMREMEASSIDAIVTDPPYGLVQNKKGGSGAASVDLSTPYGRARIGAGNGPGGFMGNSWDSCVPGVEFWAEALRVAKPGAHLVAFGGTRTFHRLAVAIEDAGWEIRDCLSWIYGSGFPKSKNLDGAWQGWGTALKPAWEPIILARKPLVGTVAANVLAHGTGGLNIDATRIETDDNLNGGAYSEGGRDALPGDEREGSAAGMFADGGGRIPGGFVQPSGRWPANVALDEEAAAMLDEQTGTLVSGVPGRRRKPHETTSMAGTVGMLDRDEVGYADSGGASRFFYCAKASRKERGEGNTHPTVKPISLMRWLVRLVTPPGGTVLDPFAGSGTTGIAAHLEGFDAVLVENQAEYIAIIEGRFSTLTTLGERPEP